MDIMNIMDVDIVSNAPAKVPVRVPVDATVKVPVKVPPAELSDKYQEIARYYAKNPGSTDRHLSETFKIDRAYMNRLRHSALFQKFLNNLKHRKDRLVIEKLATFEAEGILNGAYAQTYLGDRLREDVTEGLKPKSRDYERNISDRKKTKDKIALKAVEELNKTILRKGAEENDATKNTINIDKIQVNVETMPIKDLLEFVMKGSLKGG